MAWGKYLDSVNVTPLSFGGSGANLKGFIGPWQLRVQWRTWWKIALYLAGFLAPGFAVAAIVTGLPVVLRERPRLLIAWLLSLVVFYLLWLGNGPASQGYYNLPALVPCAALFALGVDAFLRAKVLRDWTRTASVVVVVATIASAAPIWKYLFMQDRTILAAALWARNHTEPSALILFRAAHRADMKDYPPDAVFPFYAERRALTWTEGIPEPYRTAGLERALYAVVTLPQTEGKVMTFIRKLRGLPTPPPESIDWLRALGFSPIAEQPEFIALRRP